MALTGTHIGGHLIINPVQLASYARSTSGPVLRDLERRMTNVQTGARNQVGKKTRTLEKSIVKRAGVDARGPYVMLVTEGVDYGLPHHEGTPPHVIQPRTRRFLRFPVNGQIVFARIVHHPGTQPNHYFTDNIRLARD